MYGKILRIDLTERKITEEPIPKEWQIKYLGGEGTNDRLFWDHFFKVDPHIDPLSPENVLICGVGPLGATGALGAGTKVKWTFKSPAYGIFGDSVGGGFFGSQLRWAGYDHMVITGRAEKPVYIWINDGHTEIRDASHLWGKNCHDADSIIKEELGSSDIHTAITGQAGENLVRFASITLSRSRAAARTGGGCVMGSKNLKAIAVKGTKGIKIFNPERFLKVTKEAYKRMDNDPMWEMMAKEGTMFLPQHYNIGGGNPWLNHQYNMVPETVIGKIDSAFLLKNFKIRDVACSAGCALACDHWWKIKGDETPASAKYAGEEGGKPEYLVNSSCMVWGNEDLAFVLHFQNIIEKYSLDALEMGQCIAFLMELYQRGIITEKDMKEWTGEPLSLNWGDYQAAEKIIDSVALRKNSLYDILGGGVYQAAKRIEELKGIPVMQYCQYGGKGSPETEDIRTRYSWTLLLAVATRGADHLKALSTIEQMERYDVAEKYLGSPLAANPRIPHMKAIVAAWEENRTTTMNCTGLCIFNTATFTYTGPDLELVKEALGATTGIEFDDLLIIGERVNNMEKAFNSCLGLTRRDDTLCHRWMKEPVPKGCPGEGRKGEDYFGLLLDEYYEYRGFDPKNGLQTKEKLEELGLEDIAACLEKGGTLSKAKPKSRDKVLKDTLKKAEDFKAKLG